MHGMEVTLPGGLSRNGKLQRQATFRPLTGNIEQALIEIGPGHNRPEYVSTVLSFALDRVGDQLADFECVSDLCVADRQYLMLRLAALMEGEQMWLKVGCNHCHVLFDVEVRRCDLPVKQAAEGFPSVSFRLNDRTIGARIPTGVDQQQLDRLSDEEAIVYLLQNCIDLVDNAEPKNQFVSNLSETDIGAIDDALDEAAPAICNQLIVKCPECGQQQYAELDHYALNCVDKNSFYDEIHTLASHYHWSETAILDMPQSRRRLYINLINRAMA